MRPINRFLFAHVPTVISMVTGELTSLLCPSGLCPSGKAPTALAARVCAGASQMCGPALLSHLEDG